MTHVTNVAEQELDRIYFEVRREIGDFILTIPDPRGSRPTRSAKVRFEKCILHSLFQQPRIVMTHVTNVAEQELDRIYFEVRREIGDFILTIPDPRGSRPTRSAKVRFEKCILHSLFQRPRIVMTHVTNVAEQELDRIYFEVRREIGDFILTIPDPRGSRPTRSAKVRFEKCILHSLFQRPRIVM